MPHSVSLIGWPSSHEKAELKNLLPSRLKKRIGAVGHRVDETNAVDELAATGTKRLVEARQILRRDGQVGVEDHEDVAGGGREARADRVALAGAGPGPSSRRSIRDARSISRSITASGVVARVPFDEDQLGGAAHRPAGARRSRRCCRLRCARARRRTRWAPPCLIGAAGWQPAPRVAGGRRPGWSARASGRARPSPETVTDGLDQRRPRRPQEFLPAADRLQLGQVEQVDGVRGGQPILRQRGLRQAAAAAPGRGSAAKDGCRS